MPTLDALASHGVLFRRAYCTTPHTSYSLASLMMGTYARSVLALPGTARTHGTLASWLGAAGYVTAGFFPPAVFAVGERREARAVAGEGHGDVEEREREARARRGGGEATHQPASSPTGAAPRARRRRTARASAGCCASVGSSVTMRCAASRARAARAGSRVGSAKRRVTSTPD